MNQFLLALSFLGFSAAAQTEAVAIYKFPLESTGSVLAKCQHSGESVSSKIFVNGLEGQTTDNAQKVQLKFRVCAMGSVHKLAFQNYLPRSLFDSEEILKMREGEKRILNQVPSTKKEGRKLTLEVMRLPKQTVTWNSAPVNAYPFAIRWVNEQGQKPEYPPMKIYLTDVGSLNAVAGFQPGRPQWLRLEIAFDPPIGDTLNMRGFLGEIEWVK